MDLTLSAIELIGAAVLAGFGGCFGWKAGQLVWADAFRRVMDIRGRIIGARKRRAG